MAETSPKGWVPESLSCFVVRNREDPHKPRAPGLKPSGDVLESCWRSWSRESGWCEHSPATLSSDTAPPSLASASSCQPGGFHAACGTTVLSCGQKAFYYGPGIASHHQSPLGQGAERREEEGWEQKLGRRVERIRLEGLSQWRMFSWSSLGEMLPLLWLQLCRSPGHVFSGDVCFCFSAVASGAAWRG